MKPLTRTVLFFDKNKKLITIIASVALSLLFIGSMLLAMFIGGELNTIAAEKNQVTGIMQFAEASYSTSYFSGDKFEFDKNNSQVCLIVKDPSKEQLVNETDLAASKYGFKVNGEGAIIDNASSIVMTTDVRFIDVVSKDYPSIKVTIPVSVVSVDGVEFKSELTLEAEEADMYLEGELLTESEKLSLPETAKPFLSSGGTGSNVNPSGVETCSGGACIRNLGTYDVTVEFTVVCKENTAVDFTVLICKRPKAYNLGASFQLLLNGNVFSDADNFTIPAGGSGVYFESYTLQTVSVTLNRGVNVIQFVNLKSKDRKSVV